MKISVSKISEGKGSSIGGRFMKFLFYDTFIRYRIYNLYW